MTGTHDGCPDIKVTPTPSGGLLLIGPEVTQVPHPVALITAMGAAKPVDAELVHLIEQRPLSADTQRFFAGQPYRENLVVAPWALVDGPAADTLTAGPEPAVRYADFLGLQIQVPPERIGRSGSARLLPVDEAGRVTGWDRATAVRVLPLAHVAARAAVALAIEVATGPEPPSWQRLAGFLARLEAAGGAAVPGPALAAAVRLARYGLPAGVDPAEPGRSAMPMSTAGLLDLLDGAPAAMPPGDLLDKIRAGGQGAALVLYRPFHSAPRQIAWIVADGGRLWWIEAGQGALAVPFDPETDARHRADLADPDTLVVPMGDPPVPGTDPLPPEAPPQALRDLVPETAEALQRAIVTVRARFLRGPAESDAPAVTAVAAALRAQRPAEWPVPPHLLDTAREAFLDLLMAYDFLVAQSADPGFVPVDRLFDGPDAYTWLTGIGFTPDDAHRIATDGDLALDPDRIGPLVAALGLADAGTRRLVEFSEALGRIPDDLPAIAAQIGLAGPGPLWAVARDLGVPPEDLRVLAQALVAVVGGATAADPAEGGSWTTRLREHLAGAGVRTDEDLLWLIRLGVRPDRYPLLGVMRRAGVSLELLAALPPGLVREALDAYAARVPDRRPGTRIERYQDRLGIDPRRLLPVLAGNYLERLLFAAAGDLPAAGVGERLRQLLPTAGPAAGEPVADLGEWADRLEVPADRLARALNRPGVDAAELSRLAGRARLAPDGVRNLVELVAETGRVPDDLRWWAYRLRTSPERLAGVGGRLLADPRRLAVLGPVFERIGRLPAGQQPTDGELARMIRDHLRAGQLTGPPSAEAGLWLAGTVPAADGPGLARLPRLLEYEPFAVETARYDHRKALEQLAERLGVLERVSAVPGVAAEPALAGPLTDGIRAVAAARDLLSVLHRPAAVPARAAGSELSAIVDRAAGDLRSARGTRDEPAARTVFLDAARQVTEAVARASTALRDAAGGTDRLHRLYAVTAAGVLDDLRTVFDDGLQAWRLLADGPNAGDWLAAHQPGSGTPVAEGLTADALLATWWSGLTGIPAAVLAPALGPSGWIDPVDLLRLAGPAAALGPGARDLLQSLAIESRIPVRALEPLLGYLRDAGPASAEEISTRLRTLNAALPEALGPPDALGARLSFLADRGLTPADLNDPARAAEEARAWLGDLFGVDAAVAAEMLALPGAGIAAATVIFTDLRGHLTRQGDDPGWEPATFAALATAVDASEPWLLGFSLRTGRVPVEVPDLARQWDVTPVRLFRLAAELGADPRKLSGDPAVVEALRVPGDDRTAVREAARLVRAAGAPEPAAASPARDLATIALRTGRLPGDVVAAAEDLGIGAVELLSVAAPLGAGPGAMAGFLASRLAGDTVVDPTALRALAAGYPAWAGGLKTRFAIAEHEITGLVWAAAEESRTLDYLTRLEPARAASVLRRWRESAAEVDRDTDSTVSDFEFSDAEPDAAPESRQPAPVGLRATGETGDGLDHLVRVVLDSAAQQSVPLPSSVTDVASFWTFLAGRLAEDPAGFADQLPSSVTVAGLLSRLIDPEPAAALALLSADADDLTSPETLRHLRDYYREDGDTPVGRLLDRIERSVSRSGFADLGDMLTALAADPRLRPALAAADPEALIARALRIDLVPVQGGEIVRHTQPRRMPVVHLLRSGPDGWQSLRRDGEAPPLTREQLTRYLGAPMPPGWVRPIELDPPRAAETGAVAADDLDDTHRVMLNAYLMPLADFTPEIFAGRPNAQWNFAVLPDGRIYLGGEGLADLISDAQLRELYLRMSLADPALTWDGLRTALGGRGHPSVTAAFDAAGQARPGPARLAGELLRDRHTGRFYLNDHSGRYMDGRDGWAVRTWLENAAAMISAQVGEPVDVRPYREGDVQPAMRIVEVDTERWTPLRDALRITPAPDGGRPRIDRPVDSGERTAVRYRLTATDRIWYFTLRVSLTGGSEAEREAIRRAVTDGVNRHLTEPGHTLPGSGARMHVDVAFVADDQAHTRITVGDPAAAGQRTWPAHLPPAWYAGQVARHLGVRDARPPETALLRSGPDPVQAYTLTSYTVGSDALGEIAAVLAPHFSGSTASRTPSAATGGHLVDGFWTSGADRPPVSRLDAHGWLLGAGVPADQARRLAADPDLGFHPVHTPALIRRLGLDADGIRRFVDLGEAAGGLTGDELYDAAGELGLAGPAPLYAVSRDLGVPVGMLAPLGEILAGLAIGESGLRPATGTWTGRLIERLRPAGVHDEAGLIWLLRLLDSLEVELDLEESMPGLQRMQEAGLSLELLATLPPALAEQAVDTYLDREAGAASPAGGTRAELWSRRLGFPAEQLRDLLPDPNLEALLHPVLGDVAETRTAAETVAVLGPGQGGPARAEDVTQWAYLLRTDVVVVRDVARALGVPPARLMPLAPVFHRLAALPEGERPTAGRLARIIRDYLRAGTPDGPATVGTALLRARTGLVDLADLTGREVATRQAAYRQILAQAGRIDGARTALAAVIAGAGQPAVATEALSALLADATARIAAVAGAVSALRNGGPLGVDVRAVHADLGRIARALADPPATAGDEVRRVAAAARAAVVTVGDALPRAITAGRRLVAGPTGDQWRELITGARPGPPDHEPADAEREADRVLADWWAERLGIPVADLAPALGRAGWLDPSGLLALARRLNTAPADLFATARRERGLPDDLLTYADRWKVPADLLHRLAADLRVPVRALAPVVPLLTGGTATLPAIKDRIDAAVAGLHDVLGGAGDRRLRLEFLADRGLTVHDLDDTWLVQRSARRWLADVYGMDVDQARTAGPHTLDLAEAVRADRELRHPDKGWSTAAIARTAALLEVSPAWLRGLSVRIGRVPHDLLDLGRPLGPRGAHRLFRLAAELGENPGSLPPEATRPGILDRDGDDRLVVARAAADLRAAVTNGRAFGRPSVTAALTRLATTAGVSPADLIRLARDLSLAPGALLAEAERQGVTDPDLTPEEAAREYRAWLLRANQPGIEVDTERWWPLAEAFRIEPGAPGERPRITRPAGGGELVGVRYRLTPGDQEWTFTVRVHLTAVGDVDLADVRARTLEGVQEHVNRPGYRLPGVDVPMRVAVVFVDDPAQAHTRVRVTADGEMDQRTWPVGQDPRTYAHEVVHGLGARDLTARTGSLLRDTAASPADAGDLMAPLTPTGAVLGPRTLRQIADVLAPHFAPASTPRPEPGTGAPATAEQSWQAGTDRAPLVGEDVDLRQLRPATRGTEELPGGYASDPQLLNRVDDVEDPAAVWADLEKSITDAIRKRVRAGWREGLPGLRSRKPDLSEIREALAGRPKSFFSGGGRSFDVRDGTFHWHRVTIKGKVEVDGAGTVDQSADAAKFDTRLDGSLGQKSSATAGGTGVISFGVTIPQRVGPGGGFGGDLALSRPMESMEAGAKLGDSHNIRGGSGSHLVQPVTRLTVTVTDARGPLTADDAVDGDDVSAPVTFRTDGDIIGATRRENTTEFAVPADQVSTMVENFFPEQILHASLAGDDRFDRSWHDVAEEILLRLAPTKTVEPGTAGASEVRGMLDEDFVLSLLLPALDGVVHPPVVRSPHGAHTLSLDVSATLPALQPGADIAKSSFRWQPGLAQGSKVTHESRVGGGLTVVPFRWGFGAGYVQFRLFGGHYRSMISSANSSGESRIGTEFKDIPNVLIAVHMQVTITPAVREAPLSRNPFGPSGAVAPITVDLAVSGRMPATRLAALMAGTSTLVREPDGDWHVPPFAYTGGRSVTLGLSRFAGMQGDVAELIRRFEGGFLPRFTGGRTTRLYTSRAALERQNNQAELDRVLTPAGLRQGKGSTLKHGQIAELTRTKKWGTRHIVVHVTSRYLDTFTHVGTERGVAVRTARIGAGQHKVTAGRQVRSGAGVDGGAIFRFVGRAASALVPSGVLEGRLRWARRSGMQFGGQETRLHGGTPDSAAFRNRLQLIVDVYAYTRRLGHDPQARIGMGRVIRQRLPRPAPGTVARPATVSTVAAAGGQRITRYRLTDTKTVTELFDKASVLRQAVRTPPVFTARPDPLGLTRRTPVPLDTLRDWVDDPAARPVRIPDWLSIDGMPASRFVVQLAQDALRGAQQYQERQSRTKLHGQRGTDSLLDGMPLWAGTIGRLSDEAQIGALREMLAGQWFVDKLTPGEAGAATDLAVAAGLVGGEILEAYGTITTETGTTGVTEVDGVSRTEQQLVLRGNLGMNVRKTGAAVAPTSGGGALFTAGYERLLWSRTVQDGESVSAQIERIANNRKAKVRSYLVKFDLRLSVAAEVTNEPDRYAFVPHALRTGSWLHHIKSIRRDGTVRDALYLRLSAATVDRLGLLQALHGDRGRLGDPWHPGGDPHVRLAAGQSIGLGLHRSHLTPDLTSRLITAMGLAGNQTAVEKIHASLTEPGLGDPMLNRRRLEYLFSPDGIARHLPSMADGGASALHVKPGRLTQHSRDLRVIAEPIGPPELVGFLPDHDDLDVKTTHVADRSHREQRAHGHTTMAGVAGTGVTNQQGENLALGAGDAIAFSTQIANAQESGRSSVRSDLSSARGVKARIRIPTRFSLVVYDQGRKIPTPLLTVDDAVVQDRWAGDLRLPRPRADAEVPTPVPYRIGVPDSLPPGWADTNGVPLPSRFSAEDLNQIAELQKTVEKMLSGEAKRLAEAGYAGAHQIHAGLSPEMLLPGVPAMLSPGGLDLPAVTSAQILGQRAEINIRLLPESASLGSVSSGVFREHVTQENAGRSAGTNRVTQSSRMPQVPIVGRGYADDPYQALELGGPGAVSGDATVAAETQNMTAADGANVKPESRSAAVDLLSRVVVTIKLPKPLADLFGTTRIVLSPAAADRSMVRLRMGLHDARTVLSLPEAAAGADQPARAAEFDRLVVQEAALNRAAGGFQRAADALAEARYEGHADPDGSTGARAAAEARLPGLLDAVDRTGEIWWKLAQEHFRLVDQFRHRYIGVSTTVTGTGEPVALARLLRQITLDTVLPVPAPPVPPLVPVPPVPTPEPPVPVPVPPVPVPPVPLAPVVEAPEVEVIADPPVVVTPELEIVADPPGGSTAGLEVVVVPAVVVSSEVTEPLGSRVPPGLVQRIAGGLKTSGPAREIDGVLVIGEPADWQARETTLRTMIDRLAASGLPAIVVDGDLLARGERAAGAPGRIREGLEPTALNAALRAFDRAGVRPVVVATGRSERLTRLADAHEVVSIVGVPTDLGHSWQLSGPSGVPVGAPAELGPDLLAEAGRRAAEPVEATVGGPPEVLQEWLAAPDWAAAGDYLTEHLAELNTPEVTAALQAMRADAPTDRELGAYQAVQELAQQAGPGQPADAFVPRPEGVGESSGGFVAQSDAVGEPDGASVPRPGAVGDLALPEGPLSPSFALHYLTPVQGYEQRAPWNDQLLRVLYERRLSPDRTVDLARGLLARDGPDVSRSVDPAVTNAMVFEAVAKVLALTPEQAADVNNTAFREALKLVEDCVVTPTDRWLWILRLGWLRDRMQKDGVTHLDALIRVLTETLSNC